MNRKIYDLQDLAQLMCRASDAGYDHDAWSEVCYYWRLLELGVEGPGISWHSSRACANCRQMYQFKQMNSPIGFPPLALVDPVGMLSKSTPFSWDFFGKPQKQVAV